MTSIISTLKESFLPSDDSTSFLDRMGKHMTRVKNHEIVNKPDLTVPGFLDILLLALATSKAREVNKYQSIVTTLNTLDDLTIEMFAKKLLEWERSSGNLDNDVHNKQHGDRDASARATQHGAFAATEDNRSQYRAPNRDPSSGLPPDRLAAMAQQDWCWPPEAQDY